MPANKRCPRCKVTKPIDQFGKRGPCRACVSVKNAIYRAKASNQSVPLHMSDAQFRESIDFRWMPDGVGGFHYRWIGPQVFDETFQSPLQRFAKIIGDPIPDGRDELWCEAEAPGCINPDHLIRRNELPNATGELTPDESGRYSGWLVTEADQSPAEGLRRLEAHQQWALENVEADRFLRQHGFSADGQPLRWPSRKAP